MQHDSSGQAEIVLCPAEETGLQEISLDPPADDGYWLEVDASADSVRERSVRAKVGVQTDAGSADQVVGEGCDLSYCDRNPWPEKEVVLMSGGFDGAACAAATEIFCTVVSAEIRYDPDKR